MDCTSTLSDTVSDFISPCESLSATADENGIVSGFVSVSDKMSIFTETGKNIECTYNRNTTYIIEEVRKDIDKLRYRLINSVTLEENMNSVLFATDMNGKSLSTHNLQKVFILFIGSFVDSNAQVLCINFNGGTIYQMYQSYNITADRYYGFWAESEKIIENFDMSVFKSTYPSNLLTNFTADGFAQGLSGNNSDSRTDLSVIKNGGINNIKFGCSNGNNLMKTGSKIYLFGV